MKYTFGFFYHEQYGKLPSIESMTTDLSGKTVIVLGANTGLGLECTRHIASMMGTGTDAGRLIMACRNVEKAQTALESIRKSTGYTGGEVWPIDLMDFASVSAFADKFEREGGDHLDLLIENSGISTQQFKETKDGWESTIQTNHLGTSLLAILMLPYLLKSSLDPPCPRLTIVASDVHYFTDLSKDVLDSPVILEKLSDEQYCTPSVMRRRYFVSKLLNVLFMRALASHIPSTSHLVVNALNPGYCRSGLGAEFRENVIYRFLIWLSFILIARPTEEGGRKLVHALVTADPEKALSKQTANDPVQKKEVIEAGPKALHGKFMSYCQITEESDFVLSEDGHKSQDRLWHETIAILSKVDDRVYKIVKEYLQ